MKILSALSIFLLFAPPSWAIEIDCTLTVSAGVAIQKDGKPTSSTSAQDKIHANIQNIGDSKAVFNKDYELTLLKSEPDAFYYTQNIPTGLVVWSYFPGTKSLTYAKIRTFPITGLPDSYLMIGSCTERK
ncbi:MAG: hypothetical protein HOP23_19070 [Methylococcaceae bacterium]|nr:hypothetical protein [Methylococcaceae bacterium]